MSDAPQSTRHEIMEERGNRDAFKLCVIILAVVALGLVVLGIAAWKMNVIMMPLMPRDPAKAQKAFEFSTSRAQSAPSTQTALRSITVRGVDHSRSVQALVEQTCGPVPMLVAARLGLAAKAIRLPHTAQAAGPQKISGPGREANVSRRAHDESGVSGAVSFFSENV